MINKIKAFSTTKFFEYFLLALILLGGFLLRIYKIDNPIADWHSWRQADTASVTRNYVHNGIDLLLPRFDDISSIQSRIINLEGYRMVEFPFYNAISAAVAISFPYFSIEITSRLITILIAIVTAFFLFLIGREYLGRHGGLLSAFFYMFIPFNIYFTRVILPDPLGVCFGVISVWLFKMYATNGKILNFYWSALFFAMMLLIKPYLAFYSVPIIYIILEKHGYFKNFNLSKSALAVFFRKIYDDKQLIIKFFIFFGIGLIPLVLWRLWESQFPEGIPLYKWAFNGNGIRFRPSYWNWIYGERLGHLVLGSMGVIPFVFGLLYVKAKNYFIQASFVGVIMYFTIVASANVMHDYYQIITIPVIVLVLANGSLYLWNQTVFNKSLSRTILVFSLGVMLINGWYQIKGNYVVNHPEIIEAGKTADMLLPKDAVVVAPYNGDTAFLYQINRKGWPAVDNSIDNIIKQGADYYVSVDLNGADTLNFEKRFKTLIKTDKYIILDLGNESPID